MAVVRRTAAAVDLLERSLIAAGQRAIAGADPAANYRRQGSCWSLNTCWRVQSSQEVLWGTTSEFKVDDLNVREVDACMRGRPSCH
jgi:hypothetical protein